MFDKEKYKVIANKILSPIIPANEKTLARKDFLFTAHRSAAGRSLPEYFLVYFLFSDLLGFKDLGQFEKIAWSFPLDYYGKAFLVDYRKFGVGIFIQEKDDEKDAEEIANKINRAIKSIRPFYDHIAEQAVINSQFSVVNNSGKLYERFDYLLKLYKKEYNKYQKNKGKVEKKTGKTKMGEYTSYKSLDFQYYQNANWLAISCIEAFFSWTEHLFIHLAIVGQSLSDGKEISNLVEGEWKKKYMTAIPEISEQSTKFYNELLIVRQQLRNFVAHGAFGKNGNAFKFHSGTGAVPVLMNHKKPKNRFSLNGNLTFREEDVVKLIEDFIKFLWSGSTEAAMTYTQEYGLPAILTLAIDGTYKKATKDVGHIREFSEHLLNEFDNAGNMDW